MTTTSKYHNEGYIKEPRATYQPEEPTELRKNYLAKKQRQTYRRVIAEEQRKEQNYD